MFNADSMSDVRTLGALETHARRARTISESVSAASAMALICGGLLTSAVWDYLSPTPIAVFSALVQTGAPTRLVLLVLVFGCGLALFALRTRRQVWYGHLVALVAVTMAWEMIRRLAIEIQPADVLGLGVSLYFLVQGFVEIQEGHERGR